MSLLLPVEEQRDQVMVNNNKVVTLVPGEKEGEAKSASPARKLKKKEKWIVAKNVPESK